MILACKGLDALMPKTICFFGDHSLYLLAVIDGVCDTLSVSCLLGMQIQFGYQQIILILNNLASTLICF